MARWRAHTFLQKLHMKHIRFCWPFQSCSIPFVGFYNRLKKPVPSFVGFYSTGESATNIPIGTWMSQSHTHAAKQDTANPISLDEEGDQNTVLQMEMASKTTKTPKTTTNPTHAVKVEHSLRCQCAIRWGYITDPSALNCLVLQKTFSSSTFCAAGRGGTQPSETSKNTHRLTKIDEQRESACTPTLKHRKVKERKETWRQFSNSTAIPPSEDVDVSDPSADNSPRTQTVSVGDCGKMVTYCKFFNTNEV